MTVNVEQVFIDFLNEREILDKVKAFADVPKDRPDAFITVERVGGGFDSVIIDRASIAVQCWHKSRLEASELAYKVDEILRTLTNVDCVTKVTRNSFVNFPDETGNNARYQLVFDVVAVS
jgi:hypothetical protein